MSDVYMPVDSIEGYSSATRNTRPFSWYASWLFMVHYYTAM